ncbi:hypothetical protein, partial [Nitrosomonas europaea]|uniref:hypothetical protein n=1 Tax=Nitrosomonas europaea TaxID=915 RepID=UPI002C8D7BDA
MNTNPQNLFNPIAQLRKRYALVLQKLTPDLSSMGFQRMTPIAPDPARGNAPFLFPQAGYLRYKFLYISTSYSQGDTRFAFG